jgi:hypothetical protein
MLNSFLPPRNLQFVGRTKVNDPLEYSRRMMQKNGDPLREFLESSGREKFIPPISIGQRMSSGYDKLLLNAEEKFQRLAPESIRSLGKLVLEFEQINGNLSQMQKELKNQLKNKQKIASQEKKIAEDELKELKGIRGLFFGIRSQFALFSGALGIKALLEGRYKDAAIDFGASITAMIPEIAAIAGNIVLGGLAVKGIFGGGMPKGNAIPKIPQTRAIPRGGGGIGTILGLAGLGIGTASLFGQKSTETKLEELQKKEIGQRDNLLTLEDVNRFTILLLRFEKILDRMVGKDTEKSKKSSNLSGDPSPFPGQKTPLEEGEIASAKKVYDGLVKRGFDPETAAAITGNIAAESSFNTGNVNPTSGAFGLMQWLGTRLDNLIKFASSKGKPVADLDTQLDFIMSEAKGSEKSNYQKVQNAKGIASKTEVFAREVERPSEKEIRESMGRRLGVAEDAYRKFYKNVNSPPLQKPEIGNQSSLSFTTNNDLPGGINLIPIPIASSLPPTKNSPVALPASSQDISLDPKQHCIEELETCTVYGIPYMA